MSLDSTSTGSTSTGWAAQLHPRSWVLEVLDEDGRLSHRFPLTLGRHLLGAGRAAEVTLAAPGVSRRHARLEVHGDGSLEVVDLGSKNGTRVDGVRIDRRSLRRSARLALGGLAARVAPTAAENVELAVRPALPPPAPSREPATTLGSTLPERLLRTLRGRVGGGIPAAAELVAQWLVELPLAAVEFRRHGFVVARAERSAASGSKVPEAPPELRAVAGPDGWSLVVRATSQRPLERLVEGFGLALELLAVGSGATPKPAPSVRPPAKPPLTLSPRLRRLYREAERLAQGEIPVLVLGESGSGKEVLAAFLHGCSRRAAGPFVAINCAALPAELLEAELFGIEKGVATGVEARAGLLERADGGTVFLDEIGDMPLALQAKVLRVLEGASFYRVGGRRTQTADVRFVAATHVDLADRVEHGGFRRDLFFRLGAAPLHLPPLRDRREDVPLLAAEFFSRELRTRGVESPGMTRSALGALCGYGWPGNVRELRNEMARAVLMLDSGEPLDLHHLHQRLQSGLDAQPAPPLSLAAAVAVAERAALLTARTLAQESPQDAWRLLGISRTTYYRKLKELGLEEGTPENGTKRAIDTAPNPEDEP